MRRHDLRRQRVAARVEPTTPPTNSSWQPPSVPAPWVTAWSVPKAWHAPCLRSTVGTGLRWVNLLFPALRRRTYLACLEVPVNILRQLTCFSILTLASTASAQSECDADSDCEQGFVCEVVGASTCADSACAEGEDCEPVDCESEEWSECVPGPCEEDSDCAEGLSCHVVEIEECVDVACPDDVTDCSSEPECTTETDALCLPAWALPCEEDSDCGPEGFSCVERERCECQGSASTEPASAGTDAATGSTDETQKPECQCEGTGDFYCKAEEIECEQDSECPEDWSCEVVSAWGCDSSGGTGDVDTGSDSTEGDPPPAEPREADAGSAEPTAVDASSPDEASDASAGDEEGTDDCTSGSISMCMPPYYDWVEDRGSDQGGTGDDTSSGEDDEGTDGAEPNGEEPDAGAGSSDVTDEVTDDDEDTTTDEADSDASTDDDNCGCRVVGRPVSSSAAWLGVLLGAALLTRRRRR